MTIRTLFTTAAVLAALMTPALSLSFGKQECKGVLRQDQTNGEIFILMPPEAVCVINPSQDSKVLATCTLVF